MARVTLALVILLVGCGRSDPPPTRSVRVPAPPATSPTHPAFVPPPVLQEPVAQQATPQTTPSPTPPNDATQEIPIVGHWEAFDDPNYEFTLEEGGQVKGTVPVTGSVDTSAVTGDPKDNGPSKEVMMPATGTYDRSNDVIMITFLVSDRDTVAALTNGETTMPQGAPFRLRLIATVSPSGTELLAHVGTVARFVKR